MKFTCARCGKEFEDNNYCRERKYCSYKCSGVATKDITGQVFGRLTAIRRFVEANGSHKLWLCQCECGNLAKVQTHYLISGNTKSCGCIRSENIKKVARNRYRFEGTYIARISNNKPSKSNISGVSGVSQRRDGKWVARIGFKNKRIHLGSFYTFEDAVMARREAEKELYMPIIEKHSLKNKQVK